MGLLKHFRKKTDRSEEDIPYHGEPESYSGRQQEELEAYIAEAFGPFREVIHEIYSPDIHVDIAVVSPDEERNYYQLITMGMGARAMQVPEEWELYGLDRAELVMFLPADWKIKSDEEQWYWPIAWMKRVARLPLKNSAWLGLGHTIAAGREGQTVSHSCGFGGFLLQSAATRPEVRPELQMTDGTCIQFYQMLPLYRKEMDFIVAGGEPDELLGILNEKDRSFVVDTKREDYGNRL